jgi:hypothetical protein
MRILKHVFQVVLFTWMQDLRCRALGQRVLHISPEKWRKLD